MGFVAVLFQLVSDRCLEHQNFVQRHGLDGAALRGARVQAQIDLVDHRGQDAAPTLDPFGSQRGVGHGLEVLAEERVQTLAFGDEELSGCAGFGATAYGPEGNRAFDQVIEVVGQAVAAAYADFFLGEGNAELTQVSQAVYRDLIRVLSRTDGLGDSAVGQGYTGGRGYWNRV